MENDKFLQLFAEGAEGDGAAEPAAAEPARDPMVEQHWQGVERLYQELMGQQEALKQCFPDFDLSRELQNPQFAGLLRFGVNLRTAYHAVHGEELIPAAMEYAARTVEAKLAGSLRSGLDRPGENGLQTGSAARLGGDAGKLSPQDYARICRMVERGERVSFG